MSASNELAALLEEHRFDPEGRICACGVECGVVCDNLTYPEHLNHALRDRFGVVDLPEPDREYQDQGPAAEWTVRGNGYALVRNDLTIVVSFKGAASPAEARKMAAALLAAANRAEAQS